MKNKTLILICALLGLSICLNIHQYHSRMKTPELGSFTDTLTVRDTITIVKPISKVERVTDTVKIITPPVTDTLRIRDTIYLPITQKYYKSKDYEAWVSGYRPHLDSIRVFPVTTYITKEIREKPKRWGLGLQVGIGAGVVNNKIVGVPYIGIGVSYNLVRW